MNMEMNKFKYKYGVYFTVFHYTNIQGVCLRIDYLEEQNIMQWHILVIKNPKILKYGYGSLR